MIWSRELPTQTGYYWSRVNIFDCGEELVLVTYDEDDAIDMLSGWSVWRMGSDIYDPVEQYVQELGGEWYGPLKPPRQEEGY